MSRIGVFIDGGYLDKVIKNEFNGVNIDFGKLGTVLSCDIPLLRTYYYNCLPYQGPYPTPEERERLARAEKFFYALSQIPRFEVRQGKLEYRGVDTNGQPIFEQKRVDILLGVDLVRLASKGQITDAAILAGDSDFLPAIEAAKADGVVIHLFHGVKARPHNDLYTSADERYPITPDLIRLVRRGG